MYAKISALVLTLCLLVSLGFVYTENHRILFTCAGVYNSELQLPGKHVINMSNIVASVSDAHLIFINVEGAIRYNDKLYHMSREIRFRYEAVDIKNGLLRIIPVEHLINSSDTLIASGASGVEGLLLGDETNGRMIRFWKLNNSVLLFGNPYSPIFSCTIIEPADSSSP